MKWILLLIASLSFLNAFPQSFGSPTLPDSVEINFNDAPFRKTPFNTGEILYRVKSGTKAALLGLSKDHLRIKIDTTEGFISYVFVNLRNTQLEDYFSYYVLEKKNKEQAIEDSLIQVRNKEEEIQRRQQYETRFNELTKKYGSTIGKRIFMKEVWIGMTEDMLLDSWGEPEEINRTVTATLVRKQYVYPGQKYIYVENGKVTAWQD
ncbi:hypothetical protein [Mariniradius sediminis]|uniref:SH3 domain-containing protein n=1 Tax=Mariniradius sediminis TaxID=2909237 RepID=A0ABS9C2S8_9BACT|nr:hypothetical protein [Mariniradius sediminis]MCF1753383.1 hypothetical protein [Mariniradius sediminis]